MDTGRLLALAEFLETSVPESEFDMARWQNRAFAPPTDGIPAGPSSLFGLIPGSPEIPPNPGCGFAGCAIGWAAHSGIFPGLSLKRVGDNWKELNGHKISAGAVVPAYAGDLQWGAIRALFKIYPADQKLVTLGEWQWKNKTPSMEEYLFHQLSYPFSPGPKEVATRLREAAAASGHKTIPTDLPEGVVPIRKDIVA